MGRGEVNMQKPEFRDALKFWLKLGFISFGGPAGQIAIMHEYLVEKKKWISETKLMHALNYCMLLPGPEAQQLATYTGWLLHGIKGGLAAGILFILPSVLILLGLSYAYVAFGHIPAVNALFLGLKPAIVAIVVLALIKIAKKSIHHFVHFTVAVLAFVAIFFLHIAFPVIIFTTIALATFSVFTFPKSKLFRKENNPLKLSDENVYYINKNTPIGRDKNPIKHFVLKIASGILLWIAPFAMMFFALPNFDFWKQLSTFFTQAALVTFGGAYAVLPYVADVSVENFGWLNHTQMIDGLALGETTPGPLIMVLAFVGFMAAYHQFAFSAFWGAWGLIVTVYYTFLPSFIFIFAGAPLIERTHDYPKIQQILKWVTAAVVGVVLNLGVYLAQNILFPGEISLQQIHLPSLVWMIVSFVAMYFVKIGMLRWIGISAITGIIYHFLV